MANRISGGGVFCQFEIRMAHSISSGLVSVGMSSNPWLSVSREYSFLDCVLNFKSTD
jgi:hypothetical protein